jgi:octaheme c-type cytochrome (tetrathionate reductase family)
MMDATRHGNLRLAAILSICMLALGVAGCGGSDGDRGPAGADGSDGVDGVDGSDGATGLSCWDLNENGVPDFPDEDTNGDGVIDVNDCRLALPPLGDADALHKAYFADNQYEGTGTCLTCHGKIGDELLTTGHWNWAGLTENVDGFEDEVHGKVDFINNFCIAVPTNEGRCTQCHIGYNYADSSFDFSNPENLDCLVCHDQTGTYAKDPLAAGNPVATVDLQAVASSIAQDGGIPSRKNCMACHAKAGGGDNVKHGDLSTDLIATTREYDVHMGTDSMDMDCVACHDVARLEDGTLASHGIGGMPFHSIEEGDMQQCTDCHGDRSDIHEGSTVADIVDGHDRLACQVCHVPEIARKVSTKVEWYWKDAGQDIDPIPVDPDTGRETYDKKKGTFVWKNNVRPALRYHNGTWTKTIMNVNDQYTETPVVLSEPIGDYTEPDAMIYPFKKMIGNQVADANNKTMLVPHLFGMKGGENPYWGKFDWDLALQDGAAYTGQTYSGGYEFVDTVMYLSVNHEVAPSEEAWGMDGNCGDCHGGSQIDWEGLGWDDDPIRGGSRP